MKKFRIITSIVLSFALLAGLVSTFATPSTKVYAMTKGQTSEYTSINYYIDEFFEKDLYVDTNKYPSELEDIYNHVTDFITKNYSSLNKKKIQEELDYLKGALRVFAILQLDKTLHLQKLRKRIESFIETVETALAVQSFEENAEQLVDNFNVAKKESQRVFEVFKTQIKGKKVLELAEYFLSRKTQGAIVHHILNIDGILFKNVDIDAFVPEEFTNRKVEQIKDKIKYIADIGVTYNKMKKKERGKTKHSIVAYINKPIDQLKKQANTFMIRAEQKVLETYKLVTVTIKNKLKDLDLLKEEKSLDFQLE